MRRIRTTSTSVRRTATDLVRPAASVVAWAAIAVVLNAPTGAAVPPQFESPHARPIAVQGERLLVVNTPDARLSIFDWQGGSPILVREVRVGLEPISVAALDGDIAWVVNHLSDDVSVVDCATGTVLATIPVGDEPAQVAVVKSSGGPAPWAAVTLSQENRVVFLEVVPPYAQVASVAIPGEDPRAMAVDADSSGLWVAVFESGNRTTLVPRWEVPSGPWSHLTPPLPPIVPPLNPDLPEEIMPANGVIVRKIQGAWRDEQGGDWSSLVTWDLLDADLVHIELSAGAPAIDRTVSGVGTLLYDLALDPATGDLWVANTEATNEILFEPKLRGTAVRNDLTHVSSATWSPLPHSLNFGGLEGRAPAGPVMPPTVVFAIPTEVLVSDIAGVPELYVTAIGGDNVAVVDPATGDVVRRLPVAEGLTGLVEGPDGAALVAVNRLLNTVHVIDPASGDPGPGLPIGSSGFDPTPAGIKNGRRFLYTGSHSLNGSVACASCHADANMDGLAWDLGDPTGELHQLPPEENGGVWVPPFHPLKGPMTTQSLRGVADTGPLHWRGDRPDFTRFNPAFASLLGGDTLSTPEIEDFRAFVLSLVYPPNPWRDHLDNPPPVMPNGGNPVQGEQDFLTHSNGFCISCHEMPLGTNGIVVPLSAGLGNQPMKAPQVRNLYEKTGFRSRSASDNTRGFGYFHDGGDHDLEAFLEHEELGLDPMKRRNIHAFLMSFDTGTHGATGRQVTVDASLGSDPVAQQRLDDLVEAVKIGGVELIVHGRTPEGDRGWFWLDTGGGGRYQSDRLGEQTYHGGLVAAALAGTHVLTFTAVPSGQGIRMGIDRDEDGYYDRTELDYGTDPADPASHPAVDIEEGDAPEIAGLTRLTGAFPQPFRSRTEIEFYLATAGEALVQVFDVSGRLVRRLGRERHPMGRHAVVWDGRNEGGESVAPSVYIVLLDAGGVRHASKVVRAE